MILTRQLFRDTKTALMNIAGHPGSARLGEALARGFGFDDHHDAKTTFDAEEASLDWLPQPAAFDENTFMVALHGATGETAAADMAATALFLVLGGLPLEDIAEYPVMKRGRVCLPGAVPDAWRTAATAYIAEASELIGERTIVYAQRPGHWSYLEDGDGGKGLDDAHYAFNNNGDLTDFDDEMWDQLADFDDDATVGFQVFCDTAFLRVREAISERDQQWVRHMEVDARGIRLVMAAGDGSDVRICFVVV